MNLSANLGRLRFSISQEKNVSMKSSLHCRGKNEKLRRILIKNQESIKIQGFNEDGHLPALVRTVAAISNQF